MSTAGPGDRVEVDAPILLELRARIGTLAEDVRSRGSVVAETVFPQVVDDALRGYLGRRAARQEDTLTGLDSAGAALAAVVADVCQADDALAHALGVPAQQPMPWATITPDGPSTGLTSSPPWSAPAVPGSGR